MVSEVVSNSVVLICKVLSERRVALNVKSGHLTWHEVSKEDNPLTRFHLFTFEKYIVDQFCLIFRHRFTFRCTSQLRMKQQRRRNREKEKGAMVEEEKTMRLDIELRSAGID